MQISLAVPPGATDSGLSIALDVFRAANAVSARAGEARRPPFELRVVSSQRSVTLASGLRLSGLAEYARGARADAWLVPGVWAETEADLERWRRSRPFAEQVHALEKAASRGALLLASCSGVWAVAATGILDGQEATTSWWMAQTFRRSFPRVQLDPRRALVLHPRGATAGAVFAQADLSLHLVRTVAGPQLASAVTRYLLLDEHPAQAPYMAVSQLLGDDPCLRRAERYLRSHLSEPLPVPALARAARTSARTLARRCEEALGLSPGRWIRRVRIEHAARLLETTDRSMEAIAEAVGLGSAGTLRRELRAQLGRSPRELRAHAQARAGGGRRRQAR